MHLLNGVIRVKLPSEDPAVYITYKGNSSILTVKNKIKQLTGVPLEKQILSYSSGHLAQDNDLIGVIAEYCGRLININLDIGLLGGASVCALFNAPDMTGRECFEERKLGTPGSGPSYRTILKGINFEAFCRNVNCIALNHNVMVPLGMCPSDGGICSYAEVMDELLCPACQACARPEDICNVYFYDCNVGIKCRVIDASCAEQFEMVAPSGDNILTLKDPKVFLRYRYIKFTVK